MAGEVIISPAFCFRIGTARHPLARRHSAINPYKGSGTLGASCFRKSLSESMPATRPSPPPPAHRRYYDGPSFRPRRPEASSFPQKQPLGHQIPGPDGTHQAFQGQAVGEAIDRLKVSGGDIDITPQFRFIAVRTSPSERCRGPGASSVASVSDTVTGSPPPDVIPRTTVISAKPEFSISSEIIATGFLASDGLNKIFERSAYSYILFITETI